MPRKQKTEVVKSDDEQDPHPLMRPTVRSTVGRALERAYNRLAFDVEDWVNESRATAQAAAISGDFDAAHKFYEMLGKSIGAVQDPKSQHLHVHAGAMMPVQEMSNDELMERRQILMQQKEREERQAQEIGELGDILK